MTLDDDRGLVRRLLGGDPEAFEAFFARVFPPLYRFALARLDDPAAAEDAVQDTLTVAVRKLGTWRGEAALLSWLFALARHPIGDRLRERRRSPRALSEDDPELRAALESLASEADGLEAEARRHELARRVQVALDSLPRRYGEILTWKYLDELPVATIAARLGLGPKAAESMLTRARRAFREGFAVLAQEAGS